MKGELKFGENGLCKCSVCQKTIPKEIERVSFQVRNRFGYSAIRICGICLLKLANQISGDTKEKATLEAI